MGIGTGTSAQCMHRYHTGRNLCLFLFAIQKANLLQENGGSITPREKDADLLICDPEKAPLSGSYSYRLIEDAVKDCSLDAKEDYLCNSSAIRPGAPAGSSSNPKLTRSRFTEKDDQALTEYVREMEASGEPINGNDIYKYFADKVRPQRLPQPSLYSL